MVSRSISISSSWSKRSARFRPTKPTYGPPRPRPTRTHAHGATSHGGGGPGEIIEMKPTPSGMFEFNNISFGSMTAAEQRATIINARRMGRFISNNAWGRFEVAKELFDRANAALRGASMFHPTMVPASFAGACLSTPPVAWPPGMTGTLTACLSGQSTAGVTYRTSLAQAMAAETYPVGPIGRMHHGGEIYTTPYGLVRWRTVVKYFVQPGVARRLVTIPVHQVFPLDYYGLANTWPQTFPTPKGPPPVNTRVKFRPHIGVPPGRKQREQKHRLRSVAALGLKGVHFLSEGMDLVEAFWNAIPYELRTPKANPAQQLQDIFKNWQHIDPQVLVFELLWNHYSDKIVGAGVYGGMDSWRRQWNIDFDAASIGGPGTDMPYEEALQAAVAAAKKQLRAIWDTGTNPFDTLPASVLGGG